ncbi:PLP-dependent aspartate aminotransferase family protein [Lutimonas saemankumensis]|uniref:trans-sulfuration enzyme family protein n=1 Tax=Lutimonas saemankumensis TaxID=483016 RepID=UPI001CD25ED1|nr:PLP-dependent aspartate aminotransferase family protein [Lutimonas saemankumensis]MCA0932057.1 PLP-dependent aspartate aminotransferase family protein [Lutimonas saemankumensis]
MKKNGTHTACVHEGQIKDKQFGGAVSPIYLATSYPFLDVQEKRYPRYFNTPNQEVIAEKLAALENAEAALPFSSGMAAISTSLFAFLERGDHVVFQNEIYGGSHHLVQEEFSKYGIEYSFTKGMEISDFKNEIRKNTKVIYLETPSNPLLNITDVRGVATLAKEMGLVSMIDNTFASPINQTPLDLGVDLVIHSATKYLGGHSDISAGAVAGKKELVERVMYKGRNFGGNLSDFMCFLLERSMKTLALRIERHNENAQFVAENLVQNSLVRKVYYPGLSSHKNHELAKRQMHGFGGMLSFELADDLDAKVFQHNLKMIKPSMSLAGIESTIIQPSLTSHALLSQEERMKIGISDNLLRLSVGLENKEDILEDLMQALIR